jgi:hypothetical protein
MRSRRSGATLDATSPVNVFRTRPLCLFAFFLGCSQDETAVRLELRDTVNIYGREFSRVPVNVASTNGTKPPIDPFRSADESVLGTSGEFVRCLRDGAAHVQVTAAEASRSFVVQCRLATRLATESHIALEPDAAPVTLSAVATFANGDTSTILPVAAISNDTTVAVVRNGAVAPGIVGYAGLKVDYGGITSRLSVEVQQTLFEGVLELPRGESRRWPLVPGRYAFTVKVIAREDLNRLNMETEGLNCSRDPRDGDMIHCVADGPAEVRVLHRTMTTAGSARAFVRLRRVK